MPNTHSVLHKPVRAASKARKSILRGTENYVSQTVSIFVGTDEYRFDIRELSAQATADIEAWAPGVALKYGCPQEFADDKELMSEWVDENRAEMLTNGKSLGESITDELEALWDISLEDAVVGWDLEEKFTIENLLLLPRTFKSKLHTAICVGSTLGEGAEDFFRRRATAAD